MSYMVSSPQFKEVPWDFCVDFKRGKLIKAQVRGGGVKDLKGELDNFVGIKILILHYLRIF